MSLLKALQNLIYLGLIHILQGKSWVWFLIMRNLAYWLSSTLVWGLISLFLSVCFILFYLLYKYTVQWYLKKKRTHPAAFSSEKINNRPHFFFSRLLLLRSLLILLFPFLSSSFVSLFSFCCFCSFLFFRFSIFYLLPFDFWGLFTFWFMSNLCLFSFTFCFLFFGLCVTYVSFHLLFAFGLCVTFTNTFTWIIFFIYFFS